MSLVASYEEQILNDNRHFPKPQPPSVSLPTMLRWISTLFVAALLTVALTACGGDSGGATKQPREQPTSADVGAATPTVSVAATDMPASTPNAQVPEKTQETAQENVQTTRKDGDLTTEEYADALEEILAAAANDDRIENALNSIWGGTLYPDGMVERINSLETADSWSEQDVKIASEFAEITLQGVSNLLDVMVQSFDDNFSKLSSQRPPEHLSDLHNGWTAPFEEILEAFQEHAETVKNTDTDIENREDLEEFQAIIDSSVEGFGANLDQVAQVEEACLELEGQLEMELERDVSICG